MLRKIHWALLALSLVSYGAFAQPPEEVPPPLPDSSGEIQAIPAEPSVAAPEPAVSAPPVVAAPVAEPQGMGKPVAPPEDNRIKGLSLAPGIGVYPIGYDSINLSQTDTNEGGRSFFSLKPMLGLAASFRTSTDKTVDFNLDYALTWREYYNKDYTSRDFENDIDGSLNIVWNDRISTLFTSSFAYFFKMGTDKGGDNALNIDTEPQLWIVANDQLKFKVSYWVRFTDILDKDTSWYNVDSMSNPASDLDDFKRGIPYSDATYADNYGSGATEPEWQNYHAAGTGLKYNPMKGTNIALDYRYVFAGYSNNDNNEWTGHFLIPKISQNLPWKGGILSLADELRFRKYDYATVGDGYTRQNVRNRLTISISQSINDYMTFEAFFRYEISGENGDNYEMADSNFWGFTGVSFGF